MSSTSSQFFLARHRIWIAAGVGIVALIGLSIWGALVAIGWMWGQAQGWSRDASETARAPLEQLEPDGREKMGGLMTTPRLERPLRRDVAGTDLGPVARYPGLTRTYWHREGKQVEVEYEGDADFAAVLDHYVKGFAAQGFNLTVQSASQTAEAHEYTKAHEIISLKISHKSKGGISVRIGTRL